MKIPILQICAVLAILSICSTATSAAVFADATNVTGATPARRRAVRRPVPITLKTLFPSSTTVGGNAFTLAIGGTGFLSTAVVRWNDSNRQTRVVDASHIEASISTADLSTVGVARVSVLDRTSGERSNEMTFRIVNGITVNVSPPSIDLFENATQKFVALVTGTTDTSVLWSATSNTITSDGVFTAPANPGDGQVVIRATSLSDRSVYGEATVNIIAPPPTISELSPAEANAGEEISILGIGFYQIADRIAVFFPGPNGTVIRSSGFVNSANRINAVVPLGASSGPLHVDLQAGVSPVSSNAVQFNRTPRLLIRSSKQDLSSGESVRLDLRYLGNSQTRPVTWSADRGTVSADGVYRAPIVMDDTLDRVHACLVSTTVCSTRLLGIHPIRIDPAVPVVPIGQTLRLSVVQGEGTVAPSWSFEGRSGSLSPDGIFSAPTIPIDSGGIPVAAKYGSATAKSSIAVTGAIPGLVNRIRDYVDTSTNPPQQGTLTYAIATSGHFAYVLSNNVPTIFAAPKEYWVDVYDISNPISPVWLDAAETVYPADRYPADLNFFSPPRIFAYENSLFVIAPTLAGPGGRLPLAVFNVVDNRLSLDAVATLPIFANSVGPFGLQMTGRTLYAIDTAQIFTLTVSRVDVTGSDPRRPVITSTQFHLPLPDSSIQISSIGPIVGSGDRAYAVLVRLSGGSLVSSLFVYDVSHDPAQLLETVALHTSGVFNRAVKIVGQRMFIGKELFDISGSLPTLLGALPSDMQVTDFNSSWSIAGNGQTGFRTFDIRDVAHMTTHTSLFDGRTGGTSTALAGDYALSINANGGLGGLMIHDVAPTGGPLRKSVLQGGGVLGVVYDQRIDSNRLYWAENSDFGPFVNIYDVGASPPSVLGRFSDAGHIPLSLQPVGNVLFVGNNKSLTVLDVSLPSTPMKITELGFAVSCLGLSGSRLFAGTTDNRLIVLDVNTPSNPVQVASVQLPGFPVNIKIAGNLALIAADTSGLLIYDVAQSVPTLRSQTRLSTHIEDVEVDGNLALVAALEGGLMILDVSDASHPTLVSQTRLKRMSRNDGLAVSVGIKDKIVYVGLSGFPSIGEGNGAVYGFDYRIADHPRLVALAGYGPFLESEVDNFSFLGSDIFVAGQLSTSVVFQQDNTQPRNVLNLYYPSEQFEAVVVLSETLTNAGHLTWIHPKMRASHAPGF